MSLQGIGLHCCDVLCICGRAFPTIGGEKNKYIRIGFVFSAVVGWYETGKASHGSCSLRALAVFAASVLKTHLQQTKTLICRNMTAALHMLTHALWESTNLWASPENGPIHSCFFSSTTLRETQGFYLVTKKITANFLQ